VNLLLRRKPLNAIAAAATMLSLLVCSPVNRVFRSLLTFIICRKIASVISLAWCTVSKG
jgi:hypothetical protein